MKISFIGTGLMGFPMSKNLLKKSLDLKIYTNNEIKTFEEARGNVVNDYQQELETIIEECAQIKFEKMAEIKIMFKNCGPERGDERDKELE